MTVSTDESMAAFLKLSKQDQHAVAKVAHGIRSHVAVLEELSDHIADGSRFHTNADPHPDEDEHDLVHDYIAGHAENWRTAVAEVMRAHPAVAKHYRRFKPEVHAVYLGKRDHAANHDTRVKKAAAASLKASVGVPTTLTPL